jgi:hypothetical protein
VRGGTTVGKFGAEGEHVEAFLREVRATDVDGWRRFLEVPQASAERRAADRALSDAPMSAVVRTAVYSAALDAVRSLGLKVEDFPEGARLLRISSGVEAAAMAIAAGNGITTAQRRALLEVFAEAGFESVQPVLDADRRP